MISTIQLSNQKKVKPNRHGLDELYHSLTDFVNNIDQESFTANHFEQLEQLFAAITLHIKEYRKITNGPNPLDEVPQKSPHLAVRVHLYQKRLDELIVELDYLRETLSEMISSQKNLGDLYREFKERLLLFHHDLKKIDSEENEILMDSWYQELGSGD